MIDPRAATEVREVENVEHKQNALGWRRDTSLGESDFEEKSLTQVVKQSAVTLKNIFMNSFCCFFCITSSKRACSCAFKSIFVEFLCGCEGKLVGSSWRAKSFAIWKFGWIGNSQGKPAKFYQEGRFSFPGKVMWSKGCLILC